VGLPLEVDDELLDVVPLDDDDDPPPDPPPLGVVSVSQPVEPAATTRPKPSVETSHHAPFHFIEASTRTEKVRANEQQPATCRALRTSRA